MKGTDEPIPPPEANVDVAALAAHIEQQRRHMRRGAMVWLWTIGAMVGMVSSAVSMVSGGYETGTLMLATVVAVATAWTLNNLTVQTDTALGGLRSNYLGPDALPALVEALEWPRKHVQMVARLRLIALLPALTPEQARLLSPEHRAALTDHLTRGNAARYPDLVLAILDALPLIGDGHSLAPVRRLARMVTVTRGLAAIRRKALAALPPLERRVLELRAQELEVQPTAMATEAAGPGNEVPAHVREAMKRIEDKATAQQPMMRLPFLIASYGIIVPFCLAVAIRLAIGGMWYAGLPFLALGAGVTQLHRLTLTNRHRQMARELAALDDVQAIGRLSEALAWPEPGIRAGAISALTRVLPRVRATDAALLTPVQRNCLYGALTASEARSHPEFVIAVLRALQQIGDLAAIPPVQALAKRDFRSARQNRVRDAARDCLPFLQPQAERNQQSMTLLRPASAPGISPELLLRPAGGPPQVDPELLVRPAEAPAEE